MKRLDEVMNLWSEALADQMKGLFQPSYRPRPVTEKDMADFLMDSPSSSHPVLSFCMWCGGEFRNEVIEEHESECGA